MVAMETSVHSPLRSPLRAPGSRKWAIDYSVNGYKPALVMDNIEGNYRTNNAVTTFADMVTTTATSNRTMTDSDGVLKWAPHNLLTYSEQFDNVNWPTTNTGSAIAPAVTPNAGVAPDGTTTADRVVFDLDGGTTTGDISLLRQNGGAAGMKTQAKVWLRSYDGVSSYVMQIINADGNGSNITVTGDWQLFENVSSVQAGVLNHGIRLRGGQSPANSDVADILMWGFHLYRSDLGGMVNNPDRGDSYVPTTSAAVYMPRRNHYIYNGTSWVKAGLLVEPTAATNLLLNSGTLSTQSVTVTAAAHTLHFTGTGTITLSGVSTAGPLVGTGTGENNRVSLTFTPTAGSLTLTVSGTVTNAQLELGSVPSSYIPTAGSTATRAAETVTLAAAKVPSSGGMPTALWMQLAGYMTYADENVSNQFRLLNWELDASNQIIYFVDTGSTRTGDPKFWQKAAGITDSVISAVGGVYAPGVNVPFNLASRHGSTFLNGAIDGTALTADTTPVALPALSSTNLALAHTGGPIIISKFRMGTGDINDAGISEAST